MCERVSECASLQHLNILRVAPVATEGSQRTREEEGAETEEGGSFSG